jgi:hypothetical protein
MAAAGCRAGLHQTTVEGHSDVFSLFTAALSAVSSTLQGKIPLAQASHLQLSNQMHQIITS